MSRNRQVGTFRSSRARGASVRMPKQSRQRRYAALGRVLVVSLGLGLATTAGVVVLDAWRKVNEQKIATVQIEGALNFVSEAAIKEAVSRFVSDSLVALDLAQLKTGLEMQPWINEVSVRREWPDRLIIHVQEEQPIARWGAGQLLNQQGQIFSPQDDVAQLQLPQLTGPSQSEENVMRQYLQFNQLLYPLGVRIRDLALNDRGAWTMTLTNGVVVRLGKDAVLERLRRLVAFLESEYSSRLGSFASLDLRYTNGIAVAYRQELEQANQPDRAVALEYQ